MSILLAALVGLLAIVSGCSDSDAAPERVLFRDVAPVSLAALPDGGFVWAERETGIIRSSVDDGEGVVAQVEVTAGGQRGLLGVAVDDSGRVYAAWTDPDGRLVVGEVSPQRRLIWNGVRSVDGANGGRIAFSPDGELVIGVGTLFDEELIDDPDAPNGKLLALDPDGPPDQVPRVLSGGWFNPFAFTWAADETLWVADNHPRDGDERLAPGDGRLDPDRVTVLPADSAPTGIAAVGDRLYVCGYNTARLDRYLVEAETGVASRAGTIAEGCRLDAIVTADGTVVFATDDLIVELADPS